MGETLEGGWVRGRRWAQYLAYPTSSHSCVRCFSKGYHLFSGELIIHYFAVVQPLDFGEKKCGIFAKNHRTDLRTTGWA